MEIEYNSADTEYDVSPGKRGAIDPVGAGKTRITLRIDDDVLEWFREQAHQAGGGNYQTLMNKALRTHIQKQHEPLEATLKRVLREKLERTGKLTFVDPLTPESHTVSSRSLNLNSCKKHRIHPPFPAIPPQCQSCLALGNERAIATSIGINILDAPRA